MFSAGKILVTSVLLLLILTPSVSAVDTNDFTITSFEADYYLTRNERKISQVEIQETIVAQFPDIDQNHGIIRAIPKTYKNNSLKIDVKSITNELGTLYSYATSSSNNNLVLKIGDAVSYVHGTTTYKINYKISNAVSFYNDHDELYWDVNGDEWSQPFGAITARIHVPSDIASSLKADQKCFSGFFGSTEQKCSISRTGEKGETIITVTAADLLPKQTLTYVIAFQNDTFEPDHVAKLIARIIIAAIVLGATLPPIITMLVMYRKWQKYGRDPEGRGTVIAEYQPPKGLSVTENSVILHETLQPKAISACIIDLAIRRYVTITELEKKNYQLDLVKDPAELKSDELDVLRMFFSDLSVGNSIDIKSLRYKLASQSQSLGTSLSENLTTSGYFQQNPSKIRAKYSTKGGLLCVLGFIVLFTGVLAPLGVGLIISGLIIVFFAGSMPARTQAGVEVRDIMIGLKEYMLMAEKERIEYMQSPEGVKQFGDPTKSKNKVHLYEKLLPYAVVMGVEKQWSEQFKDIYLDQPDWYHGTANTFNAAYLGSALGSFSSASGATFSSPSSSGGSGFSGGGGSSGGGGGGGGGGGW